MYEEYQRDQWSRLSYEMALFANAHSSRTWYPRDFNIFSETPKVTADDLGRMVRGKERRKRKKERREAREKLLRERQKAETPRATEAPERGRERPRRRNRQ